MIVEEFYKKHAEELKLEIAGGQEGVVRVIQTPEIERPGLSLIGYLKGFSKRSILVFGKTEVTFLKELTTRKRAQSLKKVIGAKTPFIILSERLVPPQEMVELCEGEGIPLLRSPLATMNLTYRLNTLLLDEFAPHISCHGSLVEIFGIGVLIQGEPAVGKSEAALGLIERGHRLISDDIVKVKKREGEYLEGAGVDVSRHQMEVRGIGIINIARLYGVVCVREKKSLDIVVKLEVWNDSHFSDRSEHKEKTISLLGVDIPYYLLPVKPGRDVVLLLETIASSHRLKILSAIERRGKQRPWENNN